MEEGAYSRIASLEILLSSIAHLGKVCKAQAALPAPAELQCREENLVPLTHSVSSAFSGSSRRAEVAKIISMMLFSC